MKKILSLLISMMFIAGGISAQETEHFKFKGIPIDGTLAEFGKNLVAEGFVKVGNNAVKIKM